MKGVTDSLSQTGFSYRSVPSHDRFMNTTAIANKPMINRKIVFPVESGITRRDTASRWGANQFR